MSYESVAEVGDTIKAFDFQPLPDRPDSFIVGTVVAKGMTAGGFRGYTVKVTHDTVFRSPSRAEVMVPFGMMIGEFDGRVSKHG